MAAAADSATDCLGEDVPEVWALPDPRPHRISYSAPIHTVEDAGATPRIPCALNIEPCRVGEAPVRETGARCTSVTGIGEVTPDVAPSS